MTERYQMIHLGNLYDYVIKDHIGNKTYDMIHNKEHKKEIVNVLNEQYETIQSLENEKEEWKHICIKQSNENSILWNEISIMREQGAEPSDAFKKYLDSISTEYEQFWNRKKEKAKEDKVILND